LTENNREKERGQAPKWSEDDLVQEIDPGSPSEEKWISGHEVAPAL